MSAQLHMDALIKHIEQDLDDTVQELIEAAQEHAQELRMHAPEDPLVKEVEAFLEGAAQHPEKLRTYVFEVFKAFGCCVFGVPAEEEQSRKIIADIDHAVPSIIWIKQHYLPALDMGQINPNLENDPQALMLAQERLNRWIG